MSKMAFKYRLNEIPPLGELILYGLQWLVITIPTIIIIGKVVAGLHFNNPLDQVAYIQKLFFITGITLLAQLFWGHGLPLIVGPASVLLVGIVASQGNNIDSIYSAIMVGGIVLSIISSTGLFGYLKVFFTPRVVATVLILIAFTLAPMIMDLIITISAIGGSPFLNIVYALVFIFLMFLANKYLVGVWKSTLIVWAIVLGSLIYNFVFPQGTVNDLNYNFISTFFGDLSFNLSLEPGIIVSFLICFLALAVNDLGSIQSVGELIKPDKMEKRITRGITVSGLGNVLAGIFGVIGPVNFSLSPGVIAATGCASRYTLIPMGLGLLSLSFFPGAIAFMGNIPTVITGSILLYIMCSQIAAGLQISFNSLDGFKFEDGLIMGLPLMLGIIISFLPPEVLASFPLSLRPILGNGFVLGVFTVLIMEHLIFKRK